MPTKPPADTEPDDLDATFGDPRGDDLIDDDRSGDLLELTEGERPERPGMKQLALLGAGLLGALVAVALLIGLFVSLADPTRRAMLRRRVDIMGSSFDQERPVAGDHPPGRLGQLGALQDPHAERARAAQRRRPSGRVALLAAAGGVEW